MLFLISNTHTSKLTRQRRVLQYTRLLNWRLWLAPGLTRYHPNKSLKCISISVSGPFRSSKEKFQLRTDNTACGKENPVSQPFTHKGRRLYLVDEHHAYHAKAHLVPEGLVVPPFCSSLRPWWNQSRVLESSQSRFSVISECGNIGGRGNGGKWAAWECVQRSNSCVKIILLRVKRRKAYVTKYNLDTCLIVIGHRLDTDELYNICHPNIYMKHGLWESLLRMSHKTAHYS